MTRGSIGTGFTWRMGCFKNPVCVFGVGDDLLLPFNLEMAWSFLEERRTWEGIHV